MASRQTTGAAETEALGAELAASLRPGDVVVVSGELGAGKTTLVRGACRALGVTEPVTSPTFTIGQRYEGGGVSVSHLDLYRLAEMEGEEPALLEDYLDERTIAFVEWPAVAASALSGVVLRVRLEHGGGDRREIELEAASPRDQACSG